MRWINGHRMLMPASVCIALVACGAPGDAGDSAASATASAMAAGRLTLRVDRADTADEGRRCLLTVTARNDTGNPALNVQAAWMAQTQGFGSISDYQVLGDFAAGEVRALQLGIFGAPCEGVRELTLSRAVCTVGPLQDPPQSCAELVVLDAAAVLKTK